ncbi:MAG TPA: nucleotidyltransferase family protein [Candidatus Omnitrophota bacterium]|nr:nucleotidyltransferase family protein [Candidatus Omnitrophota bacterium]HRZ15287.1 nucleotidyltransferase family protein [Candidatus Omnitrophota bacterium]
MENIKAVCLSGDVPVKKGLKTMDATGQKVLFIVDKKERLQGVVTDGDIRRWILKGNSLEERIARIMNTRPHVLAENYDKEDAKSIMLNQGIECIPVLNARSEVVSAISWLDLFNNKFRKSRILGTPVVIMAGGEGTRLSPVTSYLPKSLMPIAGKPIIELIIERFVEYGCDDFHLSVNYKANILKAYFAELKHEYKVRYIQETKPLGTAGSLYLLRDKIASSFFVTNCDVLIEADYFDIMQFHAQNRNFITLVVSMKHYTIPYGICVIENGGLLKQIREKPEYDLLVNTGMYVLEKEAMQYIPRNRMYHITDLINACIKKGKKIGVYPVSEKSWLDMGNWQSLNEMSRLFAEK